MGTEEGVSTSAMEYVYSDRYGLYPYDAPYSEGAVSHTRDVLGYLDRSGLEDSVYWEYRNRFFQELRALEESRAAKREGRACAYCIADTVYFLAADGTTTKQRFLLGEGEE